MKPKTRTRLTIAAILATVSISIFGTFVATSQDSHNFNVRYRLWKLGLKEWDPDFGRWLLVDQGLRANLAGKSLEEVEQLIPDLHDGSRNQHQWMSTVDLRNDDDSVRYLWIGDSNLLARFDEHGFSMFWIIKG